jgi:hypothetical protein
LYNNVFLIYLINGKQVLLELDFTVEERDSSLFNPKAAAG